MSDPSLQFVEYSDTFNFSGTVALAPGTYWLAIHNGPAAPINPNSLANFAWENSGTACNESSFNVCGRALDLTTSGSPFLSTLSEDAFNLSGSLAATPEPGSFSLLGTGFISLAFLLRRSQGRFGKFGKK